MKLNYVGQDDEFAIYSVDQQCIRYLVEYTVAGDEVKGYKPEVTLEAEVKDEFNATEGQLEVGSSSFKSANCTSPYWC